MDHLFMKFRENEALQASDLRLLPSIMYHAKRKRLKSQNPKREPKIQSIMDFGSFISVFWYFIHQIIHEKIRTEREAIPSIP